MRRRHTSTSTSRYSSSRPKSFKKRKRQKDDDDDDDDDAREKNAIEEEEDLSPRSLSRICSNIFANDGEAEEVLGAIVVVVVVVRPSFSSLSGELETRQKILKNPNPNS